MDAVKLLESLKAERSQLDVLIEGVQRRLGASQSAPKVQGAVKAQVRRHGRVWTSSMRAAMSKRLKAVIAQKKRAAEARSKAAKARFTKTRKSKPVVKAAAKAAA